MIGQFPAGLQAEYAQAVTLLGWEIAEGCICDVVSLLGESERVQAKTKFNSVWVTSPPPPLPSPLRPLLDCTCLQRELVERRQQLSDRPNCLIGNVDTVRQRQGHNPWRQAGPKSRLGDLIATGQFQFKQTLQLSGNSTQYYCFSFGFLIKSKWLPKRRLEWQRE